MALSYTLKLSESQLQKKVSAMMPIQKNKYYFTVILSNPQIELLEDTNEIGLLTHVEVSGPKGIKGKGMVKLIGSISYESETNQFFFKNPTIHQLKIASISEKYSLIVQKIIQFIARKMLFTYPVYTLKDDNIKHKFAKSMLRSVSVKNKQLLLKLNMF